MDIPKQPNECAFHLKKSDDADEPCMEDKVVKKLQEFVQTNKNITVQDKSDTIDKLKEVLNCDTESCILTKGEIKNFLGHHEADKQLETRYKPEGPFDSFEWFSNVNIDNVLKQVAKKYKEKKFLHIEFQMRDFEKVGSSLAKIDLANEYKNNEVRCFGVVFNTDYSSGNGQHWFAIYGNFHTEPFTLEYFNSS